MNMTIYKQHDSRWAGLPYPSKRSRVGGHGCGLCACVHVAIEQVSKKHWTPKTLRPYMVKHGYAEEGHGTTHQGITNTLKYIGHKRVVWLKEGFAISEAWDELNKGNRIGIILLNSKKAKNGLEWTSSGHYVMFDGYKTRKVNGKTQHLFYIKDSGPRNHDSAKHGYYIYENSMVTKGGKRCVRQMWIVERVGEQVPTPKPYKIPGPYKGKLPAGTVKKGSKGANVKAVQTFLNWCIGSKLKVDGKCGKNTVKAIKKYQKKYNLKVDGVFGSQSRRKAAAIVKQYAK